jgi:hypothetical protein
MNDTTRKIIPIQTTQAPTLRPAMDTDPQSLMAERFLSEIKTRPRIESRKQKNLTQVDMIYNVTRHNRIALVVAPEWSQLAPPYGVARMSAIAKEMGFATRVWDVNIRTMHETNCKEYWTAYEDWKWTDPHYSENIHQKIEPTLLKYIDEICAWAPNVIGFSSWYTNDVCTVWMARQFRQRLPDIKIIIGGANATQMKVSHPEVADHIVSGEGELWWVKLLEYYETPTDQCPPHICVQTKDQRIDLDSMPPADYSDMDVTLYDSGGISCEFSRGCIANCVYCNETVFWKFRARQATRVLDEIEIAYHQQKIRSVWFIDSLLNGNLKELRAFAEGLLERDIRINWSGYSRIDSKIDRDFWLLLKTSGATGFAFGVESGSQKVLDLMKKNCRVESIEQNFKDLSNIGLANNFATWFTGFPGEELTDVAQTMTLLWRLRNSGMGDQSSGTCGLGHETPLDLQRESFGVNRKDWCYGWATYDMHNTVFHRFVRFKCANILLENFRKYNTVRTYTQTNQYADLKNQYTLESDPVSWIDNIPWEIDFDYEIIKTDMTPMAQTLVNEIWPLLRVLWLGMGAFKFSLNFEPERDLKEFGYLRYPRGGEHKFWADYKFEIDQNGKWAADFDIRLEADLDHNNNNMSFDFTWQGQGEWSRNITTPVAQLVDALSSEESG